jgi:hypothetical protein
MPQTGGPAGVTGSGSINSDAMTISGGAPLVGQLFSFAAGGRNYLHMVTSISGGAMTVAPRLRAAASGAALDFVTPKLEGFLEGDTGWSIKRLRWIGQNFTLRENR